MTASPVPFSVLDLASVPEGLSVDYAINKSKEVASAADQAGFKRIWLAEHHGMKGVASAATSVMIAALGSVTKNIRIGAGGIMLPNHSPMMVAEQFGTLEALYPGRIDLGLGRAPGMDLETARALRRSMQNDVEGYPADIQELQSFLGEYDGRHPVIAVPGVGARVPIWLLGSSLYSAKLAAKMGLPFSFASHFAPEMLMEAIRLYKANFQPSKQLQEPYVSAACMAVVADTNEQAEYLFTSAQLMFADLRKGANNALPKPVDNLSNVLSEMEIYGSRQMLRYAVVGDVPTATKKFEQLLAATGADELILAFPIHDKQAVLHGISLIGQMNSVMQSATAA